MSRLAADAAHQFGGIEIDRARPIRFRLDGRWLEAFAGDTVLSAALANGIDTYGTLAGFPMGLTSRFAPPVAASGSAPMPMDTAPVLEGLDYATIGRRRRLPRLGASSRRSLGHDLAQRGEPEWLRAAPVETLTADLLVVGGGVAGLAAAASAASAKRKVIVCERRAWFGGDARYYGAVGDDESPEAATARLVAQLQSSPNATLLPRTMVFAPGNAALAHQVVLGDRPHGRVIAIAADRILFATGTVQRLAVFPGNRLPGVVPAIEAYHLAKRYGVAHGESALVATQGNVGYRLALRFSDAGVAVRRIVDTRVDPQSRFVDFAKASGLTLAGGQTPASVTATRHGLAVTWSNVASGAIGNPTEVAQLIVSGSLQPDLTLWMAAGGNVQWNGARLVAAGHLDRVMLAGAVAGHRSLAACAASGRAAVASLFGEPGEAIEDREIGADFETPDGPVGISPVTTGAPTFLGFGSSLTQRQTAANVTRRELSAGDVAASVELGTISPEHAGALAEEHGAPGGDLAMSAWTPPPREAGEVPAWLAARFGSDPVRRHLIVDGGRRFERGALVYANTGPREPHNAIGVIIAEASPGGIALLLGTHAGTDRFIVERLRGPSPARIAPEA